MMQTKAFTFVQYGALLIGAVYFSLGVVGFLPVDAINPVHHEGVGARYLLNLVAIDAPHNVGHLFMGAGGLFAARRLAWARQWGVIGGGVLLTVFLVGMAQAAVEGFPRDQRFLGVAPMNAPAHILHLVTGGLALYLGLVRLPGTQAHHR